MIQHFLTVAAEAIACLAAAYLAIGLVLFLGDKFMARRVLPGQLSLPLDIQQRELVECKGMTIELVQLAPREVVERYAAPKQSGLLWYESRAIVSPWEVWINGELLTRDAANRQQAIEIAEDWIAQTQQPAPLVWQDCVVPFVRPLKLDGMTIRQLKAIASRVKLPKYNVETKPRLAARLLAEVERSALVAAL